MVRLISSYVLFLLSALTLLVFSGCASQQATNDLPVICVDTPQVGKCAGKTPGYYYDYPSDTCRPFRYGPCHGSLHFISRDECEATCVARGK
ncbi:MAG: hypothetical protein EOM92_09630 [Gammaproteobacteria bacterium]|nr:hypothetical protein [Gammaproteobacteria bacterium]